MGGVQSGTHNLGDALWMHERQRQKCHREGGRQESQSAQSTQDRRKLLKRTRSLAVISEDESRQDRGAHHLRLGQSTFDLARGHQLIPRAKLIDRNSLKDRLSKSQQHLSHSYFNEASSYHSRSTCGLHSIPSALTSLPDPLRYSRTSRPDPDRLNILDWPDPPRRYRSVQALDTVSGLVDIVEDNWPIEGNRSIDCIYTQVKRKRKEHRSLDNILFEDESELEYFDVLNLLPLSNVRLEFSESDAGSNNFVGRRGKSLQSVALKSLEYHEPRHLEEPSSASSNATDEEKCKEHTVRDRRDSSDSQEDIEEKVSEEFNGLPPPPIEVSSSSQNSEDGSGQQFYRNREKGQSLPIYSIGKFASLPAAPKAIGQRSFKPNVVEVTCYGEEVDRKVEEAEDYKSIWISDIEEPSDMSRRPQVLKVVDNDVTKRWHRHSSIETEPLKAEAKRGDRHQADVKASHNQLSAPASKFSRKSDETDGVRMRTLKDIAREENSRNSLERSTITAQKKLSRNKQNEGRFERIVKETSNILGKACSAVKGSLGFEARSESSDLGLGSESGSDSRRRSVDDGIGEDHPPNCEEKISSVMPSESNNKKGHGSLTRSRSCFDSIECQNDGAEFDHVRYKIIKSNVFSKSMFNSGKGDVTYEGLMQYLREYSFQELLLDNNVVIIEPVRAETIERKSTASGKPKPEATCKVAGAIQKKPDIENQESNDGKSDENNAKGSKQSTIRKHFFYHPIRVNRELIDEELPDPDTVRNVRQMFENTLKPKSKTNSEFGTCKARKSVSMKDLTSIDDGQMEEITEKAREESRSRCSSRAKDLTRLFENLERSTSSNASVVGGKDELDSPRSESKTRILAQSFEARSGQTSPSETTLCKNKVNRYNHHSWDSGSVSSGVSSEYPDTDAGSGAHSTSSEDEDVDCHNSEDHESRASGHYVSQDVLKKIREYGTSVTYYGGKVVNTCNGPLISPLIGNGFNHGDRSNDYVKFRLVKSNSCDSRLELTGRLVEGQSRYFNRDRTSNLSQYTIAETPSIEITTAEKQDQEEVEPESTISTQVKREPPMVIGLEPKKDDNKETKGSFKADFKLGNFDDAKSTYPSRFIASALTRWQINETNWKAPDDFGKMEFEEFEVLEDSLNGIENQSLEAS